VILLALLTSFPASVGLVPQILAGSPPVCATPWDGIYPTVLVPFCCHGGVDVVALERQLHFELHGGVHGLLVLGTIGEGQYVTMEERADVVATAVRMAGPHVPVVVGIHTCNLETARCQMEQGKHLGAAAVLIKYVGRPGACGPEVIGFFAALSDLHLLPIFYYHYPNQTGVKLPPEDIAQILSLPGVVGIKESTLNLREVQAHLCLMRGQGKAFLSGTALNLTQFLDLGGQGAMCPEAVLLPGLTVRAYNAYQHGCHDEARCLQAKLFEMTPILRSRPTPAAVTRVMLMAASDHKLPVPMGKDQPQARLKAALNCMGVPTSTVVKCPLPPLTDKDRKHVEQVVHRLQEIDGCDPALQVPAEPMQLSPPRPGGGMLLKTGAFQLGPDIGRDLLRSQGDGKGGF
jgi:4-hydroxy-tetrahydrodipicolinate synthase